MHRRTCRYGDTVFRQDMGRLHPTQREFGRLRSYSGSDMAACQARLRAATRAATQGWEVMGRIWLVLKLVASTSPWFVACMVGLGWEALITCRVDCRAFDTFLANYGHTLPGGRALRRWHGTSGHERMTAWIFRWLRMAPSHLELRVRRLRWFRNPCREQMT